MFQKLVFYWVFFLLGSNVQSQHLLLSLEGSEGEPLSFSHAENLRTGRLMLADSLGSLQLNSSFAQQGDTLRISHIGYELEFYLVEFTKDTVLLVFQAVTSSFPEIETRILMHSSKIHVRNANKSSMPFESGDVLALKLGLKGNHVSIKRIQLSTISPYDSVLFRISLNQELDYQQHLLLGRQFVLKESKLDLSDLNLRSSSDSADYYLLIEPYAYMNNQLVPIRLNGREPRHDRAIQNILIRGKVMWPDNTYTVQWHHQPFWVPSIKVEYDYE